MYESGENGIVSAALEVEECEGTNDEWYRKRYKEVATDPKRFGHWKIVDKQLYFLRPRPVISDIVEDLDRWKLVLPRKLRAEAFRESHDAPQAGHLGIEKTYQRLAVSYYWPNMFREVTRYIRACDTCQRTKVEQASPAGWMGRRVIEGPWSAIAADIVGPLPRSRAGYQYLLVIQDLFTKWVEIKALRAATGPKIKEALEDLVISRWGTPRILLTDNGTEFVNRVMKAFAEEHGITHTTVPPYHPQANPVERVNRVLKTMIVSFIEKDHREWDRYLPHFRFAYNTALHSSLGTTPAFVNHGRELVPSNTLRDRSEEAEQVVSRDPAEWSQRMTELRAIREWVAENMDQANQRQAANYNLRRRPRKFRVGDLVLQRQHVLSSAAQNVAGKLAPKFRGPLRITRTISPVVYELAQLDGSPVGKVHVKDVKPYYPPLLDP